MRSPWALEGICGRGEGKVQRILNSDTGWKWDFCRELFKNLELFFATMSVLYFRCLLLSIKNYLRLILIYISLIQDIILTYIYP